MSHIAGAARAPYSLRPVDFPMPALAAMGARAPLGGPRETALACLLVVRLALDATNRSLALTAETRKARVQATRQWLSAATLQPPIRTALQRLADASAAEPITGLGLALETVMTVTANTIDPAARLELSKLSQTLAE